MAHVGKDGKRFGLLCPNKAPLSAPKATNVFGNDDESSEEDGTDWVKKALRAEGKKNLAKKQTRLNIERALEQDPTICQYDEVFDDMKKLGEEKNEKKKKEVKKAKYIDNLLKTAERRKREQEHRIERMVQKEREAEGAMFADKESFVTSAYRAKLEEFNKMEKEEENMDRLESIGDVTKQPDMSGFYRHLYHRTVAGEKSPDDLAASGSIESSQDGNGNATRALDRDDSADSASDQNPDDNDDSESQSRSKKSKLPSKTRTNEKQRVRQYRRRATESASESDSEMPEPKVDENATSTSKAILDDKKTADDTDGEPSKKKMKQSTADNASSNKESNSTPKKISTDEPRPAMTDNDDNSVGNSDASEKDDEASRAKVAEEPKKPKVSIWEKRTVGPIFDAALERYYTRKALRLGGS